jgi:hypothetical protein
VLDELRRLGGPHCARLIHDGEPRLKHRLWTLGLPTVVISMRPASSRLWFTPRWATVWRQTPLDKIQEFSRLDAAGIPIPRWTALYKGSAPDLSNFPDFVVVKPARGGKGALVRVHRRERVRWVPAAVDWSPPVGGAEVSEVWVIQEYVHTGPWPTSYRVATVFGEPVYMFRVVADRTRPQFEEEPRTSRAFSGRSIVAASKACTIDGMVPDEMIELATRVHSAFPDTPVLGTDIIRHHASGKLYVLETNPNGWAFHLTSGVYQRILKETGLDLRTQFGGAAAVARGLHRRLEQARK